MRPLVVPALAVHAVDAINLQLSVLEPVGDGGDHLVVFVFVEAALRRGKDDDLRPIVAEDQQIHVAAQIVRPPAVKFTIHCLCAFV